MTYEEFKSAVQDQLQFWFARRRDNEVLEANCRAAYETGARPSQTAWNFSFGDREYLD